MIFYTLFLSVLEEKLSHHDFTILRVETSVSFTHVGLENCSTTDSNVPLAFEKDSLLIPASN